MNRLLLWIGALACFAVAVTLLVVAGLPNRAAYTGQILADGQAVAPEIGAFAPPIQAQTLDGTVDLAQWRGTPVIVNFWATWCVPCRVEMPELQAFQQTHGNAHVLAVNLGESRSQIVDWVTQLGLTFDIALDSDQSIADRYRLRGQPSTYVIAPDGVITSIFYGPTTRQTLESALLAF